MKNLFKRSLTGLIFGIAVLFLILFNALTLHVFIWLVAFLCTFEYLKMRLQDNLNLYVLVLIAFLVGPFLAIINYLTWFSFSPLLPLVIISVLYHMYLGGRVLFSYEYGDSKLNIVFSAFLYISLPLILMNQFFADGGNIKWMFHIILIIWASDTFAYLIGSTIGKNKILPKVSPGKTIEGAFGGLLGALLVSFILYKYAPLESWYYHLILAAIIWVVALLGDLVESHLKRYLNIKDSGNILPGHGGFLDRFDSFVYSLPFVLLYLLIF